MPKLSLPKNVLAIAQSNGGDAENFLTKGQRVGFVTNAF